MSHQHWRRLHTITKQQKEETYFALHGKPLPPPPLLITITRIGPRKLDDDNLASACKYVRDQIAAAVGLDDGSDQFTWRYKQQTGKYGVEVEIIER